MRTVRASVLVSAVTLAVLTAVPAHADTGLTIGPARQLIAPGQGSAEVQVYNASDHAADFTATPWRYIGGTWVEDTSLALFIKPHRFTLQSQETRTVSVLIPKLPADCTLVGVGFALAVPGATGVAVRGVGMAELAVNGKDGAEADCLAVLPQPPATAAAGGGSSPALFAVPILVVLACGVAGWRLRPRQQGRHKHGPLHVGWS
jgi:hypothetical protein